jgi:Spy/CpxP family protein refolding chaperone
MTRILIRIAALGAIALGTAMAQGPGFRWRANAQTGTQDMTAWRVDRLTALLNLTDVQKQQAKVIFDGAWTASQALQPAIVQAQTDLHAAVKTGKDIDKLSAALGTLIGKLRAIHANAMSQFYSILTTTQREQFDKLQGTGIGMGLGPGGAGRGMGMGRGMGRGPWF